MKDLEEIGHSFLANNDGFFVAKAFRRVTMAAKHEWLWVKQRPYVNRGGSFDLLCVTFICFLDIVKAKPNLSFQLSIVT